MLQLVTQKKKGHMAVEVIMHTEDKKRKMQVGLSPSQPLSFTFKGLCTV